MNHGSPQKKQDRDSERNRILAAFRACFGSDAGRIALQHLRASSGHGRPAFLPSPGGGPLDPYAAAFRDGRKSIIDEIDALLETPEDQGPEKPPVGTR